MSEYIILIISLVASIISSSLRAQKKKALKSSTPKPNIPTDSEGDVWQEIFHEVKGILQDSTNEQEPAKPSQTYTTTTDSDSELAIAESVIRQRQHDTYHRRHTTESTIPQDKDDITRDVTLNNETHDTEKEFNLRDAVIYSEILKPKF